MNVDRQLFLTLMLGAFGFTLLGFVIRGTTTIAFGAGAANAVSAPLFAVAIGCAIIGFVLALGVELGAVDTDADS